MMQRAACICGSGVRVFSDGVSLHLTAIPVEAIADPGFAHPTVSVYHARAVGWCTLTDPLNRTG